MAARSDTAPRLISALELAPLPTAIPCFRLHAVAVLKERGLPRDLAGDAVKLGRQGGLKGGWARAEKLTPEERSAIARKAAGTALVG